MIKFGSMANFSNVDGVDALLGRDFAFVGRAANGQFRRDVVTVVGWDPSKGFRLEGANYPERIWVDATMFDAMVQQGVLKAN